MVSVISQLAGAPVVNLLIIAALVCIAIAIFGWAQETIAASSGFRKISGLTGVLLLFCIYGLYLPYAARSNDLAPSNDPEAGRPAETRNAPKQQAVARQAKSLAQTAAQPAQLAAASATTSTNPANPSTTTAKLTGTPPPNDSKTGAPQQQAPQSSTPQAAAQDLFSGRWKNSDPKGAGILFLKVEERGDAVTVHAWGQCGSQYCDWGTGQGVVRDGEVSVAWKQGTVQRRVKLAPDGGSLRVVLDSTLRGRPQHIEAHFAKGL